MNISQARAVRGLWHRLVLNPQLTATALSAANRLENPSFHVTAENQPAAWIAWAPRPVIAPTFAVTRTGERNTLTIASQGSTDYGKWIVKSQTVTPGRYYPFDVEYLATRVSVEQISIPALLSWSEDSARVVQRDYIDRRAAAKLNWRRLARAIQALPGASAAIIELIFRWSEEGTVQGRAPLAQAAEAPVQTHPQSPLTIAAIEVNREWRTRWLSIGPGYGEANYLYLSERRPDTYTGIGAVQKSADME